jgi:hypothetical protein
MIITEEQIMLNKEKIKELLLETKRPNIEKLIERMETADFFDAPASTIYHLNCKGGLAYHSLMMCGTLNKLIETFKINVPRDSVIIVGILHDICKMNYYVFSQNRYCVIRDAPKTHGLSSIKTIKEYIELTEKEEAMIRWHMGPYTYDGDFKAAEDELKKKHPEIFITYFADHISTLYREGD